MERPLNYEGLIGLDNIVRFSKERINRNVFPQRTIYFGEEGTGKTSLMFLNAMALTCENVGSKPCGGCETCKDNIANLINKGTSSKAVKVLRMSVEGGKDAAKESLEHLTTAFTKGVKVVLYEECHRMDDKAQDVLLSPLEFLPKNVYVMFATTDILRINKALLSRLVQVQVPKLSKTSIEKLLKREAIKKSIHLESQEIIKLIADWSDYKPRAALEMLDTLGAIGKITRDDLNAMIQYLDIEEVFPIIANLNKSLLQGINAIMELQLNKDSQRQLSETLVEVIRLKRYKKSSRISKENVEKILDAISDIDFEMLVNFLYEVSGVSELSRESLAAAFLKNHPARLDYIKHSDETIKEELNVQSEFARSETIEDTQSIDLEVPTLDKLLGGGKRLT